MSGLRFMRSGCDNVAQEILNAKLAFLASLIQSVSKGKNARWDGNEALVRCIFSFFLRI